MSKIKIWLEDKGMMEVLQHNEKLEALERDIIERARSEAEAQFQVEFGIKGAFTIKAVQTRPGRPYGRLSYRLIAGDAKTAAILSRNPGWLAKFL